MKKTLFTLSMLSLSMFAQATDIHRTFTVTADTSEAEFNMTARNQLEIVVPNAEMANKNINAVAALMKKYNGSAKVLNMYRDNKNKRTSVSMEINVPESSYNDVGSALTKYGNIVGQPILTLSSADQEKLYEVAQNKTFELIKSAGEQYCKQLKCTKYSIQKIHFSPNEGIFEPVMMKTVSAIAESAPMSTDAFQEQKVTLRTSVVYSMD